MKIGLTSSGDIIYFSYKTKDLKFILGKLCALFNQGNKAQTIVDNENYNKDFYE